MAELTLKMLGDAANAQGAFKDLGTAATAAGQVIINFTKESIKAFADSERVQRQLKLVAGEYTAALNEQAEAAKRKFAIDDDAIRQMDVMLLRYGAAPGQISAATEAMANYAAVMHTDVISATQALIRGVESGSGSIKGLGLHFKATGDFTTDFGTAVDALNKKFAGAGEEDANSLDGRMRKVTLATDDFKKAMGGLFATVEAKTGVLEGLAKVINDITESVNKKGFIGGLTMFGGRTSADDAAFAEAMHPDLLVPLPDERAPWDPNAKPLPMTSDADHKVGKGANGGGSFHKSALQQEADYQRDHRALIIAAYEKELQDEQEHDDAILKAKKGLQEFELKSQAEAIKTSEESSNEATKEMLKRMKEEQDDIGKLNDVTISRLKAQQQMWAQAGMQLGSAFADALGRAMEGGAEDTEQTMLDLVTSVLTIAGTVIGGVAGEGNPYATQAGAMLGNLAGRGIGAAYKSGRKHHDGGWIERFHSGGWPMGSDEVPAMLQTGERVLSRREVSAMGGSGAVDSMARGGGGSLHVHVSAIDTKTTREFFENDGGRGFYNALRTGRGSLTQLFGGGR